MKSKKKLSLRPRADPETDRWFSGPVKNINPTFSGVMNSTYGGGK